MSKFSTTISLFLAGLPFISLKAGAAVPSESPEFSPMSLDPVQLRPLNYDKDNLFASHSSHSSHSSHASHYSGSSGGGTYTQPVYTPPAYTPPAPANYNRIVEPTGASSSGGTNTVSPTSPVPLPPTSSPKLSLSEKRMVQIIRVQIALTKLGLYSGRMDGELNSDTKESLKEFQLVKGIPESGLMTTDTLNALGIMAVP